MCQSDSDELNLATGDRVAIEMESGTLEANIRVKDNMAAGTLIIPRHKKLDWQKMDTRKIRIRPDQIQKQND